MDKDEFWLRLLAIGGHKLKKIRTFARKFPLYIENPEFWLQAIGLNSQQKRQFFTADKKKINCALQWISDENHHLIVYSDPRYPDLLRYINSAPIALFVAGNVDNLLKHQLAMVGSRNPSHYGRQWGHYFASELSAMGLIITSGLAMGIDAICHQGALDAEGKTIAVLGSGLSQISPQCNQRLADEILDKKGTLVSEFFPTESALPAYFPRRNRIISGLSQGVFVIEASLRSGSLITARYALEQGRDVFALPGALGNYGCEGTHWLIQQGANLVAHPTDITELLNSSLHWLPLIEKESLATFPISTNNVLAVIEDDVIPIDIIAERTNQSVSNVMIELLELELSGLVIAVSGGYIRNRSIRV